jgi:hypothetical protein
MLSEHLDIIGNNKEMLLDKSNLLFSLSIPGIVQDLTNTSAGIRLIKVVNLNSIFPKHLKPPPLEESWETSLYI